MTRRDIRGEEMKVYGILIGRVTGPRIRRLAAAGTYFALVFAFH